MTTTSKRPDVFGIACQAGGYEIDSFEAGYRLSSNLKLLAEVMVSGAQARLTTWAPLQGALAAVAAGAGYVVEVEEGVTTAADVVSLVFTPATEVTR